MYRFGLAAGAVMMKKETDMPQRWVDTEVRGASMIGDADMEDRVQHEREALAPDGTPYTVLCEEFKIGWVNPFSSHVGWTLRLDKRGKYVTGKGRNKVGTVPSHPYDPPRFAGLVIVALRRCPRNSD
jgi:hypothetical protein